ncbi:DUF6789 family protein [Halomarina pelagica]|uniref:DUF6789 family protein n=1 Tax=Halomarina pelagica TaxID=2961599 RepID=UPI0020C48761|nr:DUF6789 family protein [Halomarina sp. BND7]
MERNRVTSAIAGGIAGTAVLTLLLILLEVQTREQIRAFDVIARFVGTPGQTAVGFVLFVLAGVFAWPLLFVALRDYIPRGPDPAAQGTIFAVVLWIAFAIAGRGDLSGAILILYTAYTFFAHLAYGFTLGVVYGHFREGSQVPREYYAGQ